VKKKKVLRKFTCSKCKEEVEPFVRKRNGALVLICPGCERKSKSEEINNAKKEKRNQETKKESRV